MAHGLAKGGGALYIFVVLLVWLVVVVVVVVALLVVVLVLVGVLLVVLLILLLVALLVLLSGALYTFERDQYLVYHAQDQGLYHGIYVIHVWI